ncbi:MAG: TIGR02270 family protein [Aquabacterium sp.]
MQTSSMSKRPAVQVVVQQHAEECVTLRHVRAVLLRAPHVQLHRLRRLDDRIAAHMDGLMGAGEAGLALLTESLDTPSSGNVFALAVCALQSRDAASLTRLVTLAATLPEAERGLLSALGWVSSEDLQGTVRALLGSKVPIHRAWALAACAMHRVDPGAVLAQAVQDADAGVRARAWRVAGQLGRRDLADAARLAVSQHASSAHDEHATVVLGAGGVRADDQADKRAAAWALTLWGMGQNELVRQALIAAPSASPDQAWPEQDAHRLATMAAPMDWGRDQVRALAAKAEASMPAKRRMMRMAAWVGDVQVVPWLIHHMADDNWARLAGEAFSLITGADLAALSLERKPPEGLAPGPNDDPEDHDVAMDEDDSLPWPDQARVKAWWQAQAARFTVGQRYFAGEPPSAGHAIHVLKTAGQRQRIMAAEYLCLLNPGSMMLPVAAPAWRQSRWLDAKA